MSMIPWVVAGVGGVLAGYTNPTPQPSDAAYVPCGHHHLRILFENDAFYGEDAGYTHGTRIDYAQDLSNGDAWGVSLMQNIYTPETHTKGAVMGEHPYAGYLAVGAAYLLRSEDFGSCFEFQVGTTGKPSIARDVQWFVHNLGNMEQWDGWGEQVPAEPTVQLTMRQDYRLPFLEHTFGRYEMDGIAFTREEIGTVSIAGSVGTTLRFGHNLPPSMQVNGNGAGNFGTGLLSKSHYNPEEMSWAFVAQGQIKYVAHDMFIDGGVFHHFDQTCSRKPWIAELQIGLLVTYSQIDYYLGGVYQSRSFRTQDKTTIYGTFAVTWHW